MCVQLNTNRALQRSMLVILIFDDQQFYINFVSIIEFFIIRQDTRGHQSANPLNEFTGVNDINDGHLFKDTPRDSDGRRRRGEIPYMVSPFDYGCSLISPMVNYYRFGRFDLNLIEIRDLHLLRIALKSL